MVKFKHKIVLYLSIVAILISAIGLASIFDGKTVVFAEDAVATSTWDGSTYLTDYENVFTSGSGTQDDPYLIENANQFVTLSKLVGHSTYNSKYNTNNTYYKLVTNIDLAGPRKTFAGIGTASTGFQANFDGNNLTISNFKYGTIDSGLSTVYVGLFNSIQAGGTVKNLTIDSATIAFTGSNFINLSNGNFYCGALCGYLTNGAAIQNVSVNSAKITVNYASIKQFDIGGVVGRVYNNAVLSQAKCLSINITNGIVANISNSQVSYTGLIAGSVQSSYIEKSYNDDQSSITFTQSASATGSLKNYVGGLVGVLASNAHMKQCYSNFKTLSLTTNSATTNNVGGLVGYITAASYIKNCYAKNSLFSTAVADTTTNASTNNIGGLVGIAVADTDLYKNNYKFLSSCYIVVDSLDTDNYGNAKVSSLIGLIDLSSISNSTYKSTATLQNTYYVAKNGQTLVDYNLSSGSAYTGSNIATAMTNSNAKNLNNYTGFDKESIWSNDLAEPINEGYPILMGIGNSIIPVEKQTYTITIQIYHQDETGTIPLEPEDLLIEEGSSITHQLTVPENYVVDEPSSAKSLVDVEIDENNQLILSNPTGNDTVEIFMIKNRYTVTLVVKNNVGGTATFESGNGTVYYGNSKSIVVTPATGYRFDFATGVQISDSSLTATQTTNGFSVSNITSNITITVAFTRYYTISLIITAVDNSVSPVETSISVKENGSATYQIEVPQNYIVYSAAAIKGNVETSLNSNTNVLTLSNPTGDDIVEIEIVKNSFNIIYKDQGGVAFSGIHDNDYPTIHAYGAQTTLKSATKDGYLFGGWYLTSDCSGTQINTLIANGYTADITLYAKWNIKQYTISLVVTQQADGSNGGSIAFANGYTSIVDHGTSTSLVVTPNAGYRFDFANCLQFSESGYVASQQSNGIGANPSTFVVENITHNLTITVEFIKYYTIIVNVSDISVGLVSQDNIDFKTSLNFDVDDGDSFTVYQKVNDKKTSTNLFAGWKDADGNSLGTQEVLQITPTANLNIVAEFDIKYYQITVEVIEQTHSDNNIVKVNYTQVQNDGIVNNLQMLQTITIHYISDENCYIKSVKINNDYLLQENIENGVYSFDLVGDTIIQVEFLDYSNIQLYAYSDTLTNLNNYTNINQQNYVGFAQNPNTIYATQKYKQNENVTLFAVTNEKYVFEGWLSGDDFANASPVSSNEQHAFTATNNALFFAKFSINTYTITINKTIIDENGTNTTEVYSQQSDYKGSIEYDIPEPTNYNFVSIDSDCGATYDKTTGKILVNNILASDTVTITFEKQKYKLLLNVSEGGQATIDGNTITQLENIYHNTSLQIDMSVDDGYKLYLSNIQITGTVNQDVQQDMITLNNITSDITVSIFFTKYYVVTIQSNVSDVGQVSFDNTTYQNTLQQEYDEGSNLIVYAQLDSNYVNIYEFKRWIDSDNTGLTTELSYQINNLQTDLTLTAVFAKQGFSISVVLDQEVLNPNNNFTINGQNVNYLDETHGTEITIKYNIDAGAYLEKIVISTPSGNQEMLPNQIQNNTIKFTLVTNITATVYLKAYKFNLNLYASNGSLTFDDNSTAKTVTAYDTVDIKATENEGYQFDYLSGDLDWFDKTDIDSDGTITLSNFASLDGSTEKTLNITANFKIKTYVVNVNYGVNGSVTINNISVISGTPYTYNYGTSLAMTFVANNEYYLNSVSLNGADITSQIVQGQYIVSNLQQDLAFEVDFGIKKYNLNLSADFDDITFTIHANGLISTETYFESGTQIELVINYPNGYLYQGLYYQNSQTEAPTFFTILQDTSLYAKTLAEVVIEETQNGYISVDGKFTSNFYEYGTQLVVESFADTGYQFAGFDYGFILDNNLLTVTKTVTLKAIFESKETQVIVSAGEHGTINGEISGTYYIGDTLNLVAKITDTGYHFAGYTGQYSGEIENLLLTTYTILPLDAENGRVEIIANFEIDVFEVLITSNYGGKLIEIGSKTYAYGMVIDIEVEVYDKYYLKSILYNQNEDIQNFADNYYSIFVDEPITVEFVFEPIFWIDYANMPKGLGTSDNPFVITTAEELAFIAAAINLNYNAVGNQVDYAFAYYKLESDIDLTGKFWTPIGTEENPFSGVFDFNYLKITNLSVIDDVSLYQYGGLFGVINGKVINQFRNYTTLIIFIFVGVVVLILLVVLVIFIEKRHKKPKRVVVLPSSVLNNVNPNIANKNIHKPDISKLSKK